MSSVSLGAEELELGVGWRPCLLALSSKMSFLSCELLLRGDKMLIND